MSSDGGVVLALQQPRYRSVHILLSCTTPRGTVWSDRLGNLPPPGSAPLVFALFSPNPETPSWQTALSYFQDLETALQCDGPIHRPPKVHGQLGGDLFFRAVTIKSRA